jgi:galactokinase
VSELERRFGRPAEAIGRAPGRVNLIGEHTDYNGGFVLPTVIPQCTEVALAAAAGPRVRVLTVDPALEEAAYVLGEERPTRGWVDYVQGVTRDLAARGHRLQGFDAAIGSSVPIGSGVSSSAALGVALQRALRERFGLDLDDLEIARTCQRSENEFVGARVGIMDPMVISLGKEGAALFIDTRDLSSRVVPLPPSLELVVVDSGIGHRNVAGEYNRRRDECEQAAARLGVGQLRELGMADLARIERLPEPLRRRARHVVTEDERVLEAVAALEADDPAGLGALLDRSHQSLRDDYEVSIEPIDRLVEILRKQPDVWGARMTGGGFGGSVVGIARRGAGNRAGLAAVEQFGRSGERAPRVLVPAASEHPVLESAS